MQASGTGQVKVQVGAGQAGQAVSSSEWAQQERSRARQQDPQEVGETPEGGMKSSGGGQSGDQGAVWRAEDKTATETIFRSLARKR